MVWLDEYLIFLLKVITFFGAVIAVVFACKQKDPPEENQKVRIKHYNAQLEKMQSQLMETMRDKKERKQLKKTSQQEKKSKKKNQTKLFVIKFKGDLKASQTATLATEITAILKIANPKKDHVLLRLESAGGCVHGYGYAASQLVRLKHANIRLIVAIDQVAASGGYLMACVAETILAAPFAIVGSIGVVMQLPNVHRLLKRNSIDFEQITAGEYKRTLTICGHNTANARDKAQAQIDLTHTLFKTFVSEHRTCVDLEQVATGEYWHANSALDLKLVDRITTSDDYLLEQAKTHQIYLITAAKKQSLLQKIGLQTSHSLQAAIQQLLHASQLPHSKV